MTRATADSFDLCKHNSDCFLFRASKYLHLEGLSRLSNASPPRVIHRHLTVERDIPFSKYTASDSVSIPTRTGFLARKVVERTAGIVTNSVASITQKANRRAE